MRGFGAGVIWGGALGLFGLGLASLMAPLTGTVGGAPPSTGAAAVIVPAGSEFARPKPEAEPVLPHATPAPATTAAPRVPAPQAPSAAPAPDSGLPAPPVTAPEVADGPSLVAPEAGTTMPAPAVLSKPGVAKPSSTPAALAAPPEDLPPVQP